MLNRNVLNAPLYQIRCYALDDDNKQAWIFGGVAQVYNTPRINTIFSISFYSIPVVRFTCDGQDILMSDKKGLKEHSRKMCTYNWGPDGTGLKGVVST